MLDNFMTAEMLATYTGQVIAVGLIVQFTKSIVKKQFGDASVRLYAFLISLVLTFIFVPSGSGAQGIALAVLNSILVTMSAMGGYELVVDPYAEKKKEEEV